MYIILNRFLNDIESSKKHAYNERARVEAKALESFRAARSSISATASYEDYSRLSNNSSSSFENNGLSSSINSSNNNVFVIPPKQSNTTSFTNKTVITGDYKSTFFCSLCLSSVIL